MPAPEDTDYEGASQRLLEGNLTVTEALELIKAEVQPSNYKSCLFLAKAVVELWPEGPLPHDDLCPVLELVTTVFTASMCYLEEWMKQCGAPSDLLLYTQGQSAAGDVLSSALARANPQGEPFTLSDNAWLVAGVLVTMASACRQVKFLMERKAQIPPECQFVLNEVNTIYQKCLGLFKTLDACLDQLQPFGPDNGPALAHLCRALHVVCTDSTFDVNLLRLAWRTLSRLCLAHHALLATQDFTVDDVLTSLAGLIQQHTDKAMATAPVAGDTEASGRERVHDTQVRLGRYFVATLTAFAKQQAVQVDGAAQPMAAHLMHVAGVLCEGSSQGQCSGSLSQYQLAVVALLQLLAARQGFVQAVLGLAPTMQPHQALGAMAWICRLLQAGTNASCKGLCEAVYVLLPQCHTSMVSGVSIPVSMVGEAGEAPTPVSVYSAALLSLCAHAHLAVTEETLVDIERSLVHHVLHPYVGCRMLAADTWLALLPSLNVNTQVAHFTLLADMAMSLDPLHCGYSELRLLLAHMWRVAAHSGPAFGDAVSRARPTASQLWCSLPLSLLPPGTVDQVHGYMDGVVQAWLAAADRGDTSAQVQAGMLQCVLEHVRQLEGIQQPQPHVAALVGLAVDAVATIGPDTQGAVCYEAWVDLAAALLPWMAPQQLEKVFRGLCASHPHAAVGGRWAMADLLHTAATLHVPQGPYMAGTLGALSELSQQLLLTSDWRLWHRAAEALAWFARFTPHAEWVSKMMPAGQVGAISDFIQQQPYHSDLYADTADSPGTLTDSAAALAAALEATLTLCADAGRLRSPLGCKRPAEDSVDAAPPPKRTHGPDHAGVQAAVAQIRTALATLRSALADSVNLSPGAGLVGLHSDLLGLRDDLNAMVATVQSAVHV